MNPKLLKRGLQLLTVLVVGLAVLWTFRQGWHELRQQDVAWGALRWTWLPVALLLTMVGTVPGWLFWHVVLHRFGLPLSWGRSFRAFYLSQLGKYVPGKVMVLAIRASIAGGVQKLQAEPSGPTVPAWFVVSAAAVAETLMFIAIGSGVGLVCGASLLADRLWVVGLGALVGGGIMVSMLPPVLRRWIVYMPFFKSAADREWLGKQWTWDLFLGGSISFTVGWFLMGSGLLALSQLLPEQNSTWLDLPRTTAGVSLSTVIGFLSFIPGGLGVREVVLFPILRPRYSAVLTLVILHRFLVLLAECCATAIAWQIPVAPQPALGSTETSAN